MSEDGTDPKKPRQIGRVAITFGREGYRGNDVQVAGSTTGSRRHCVMVNCRDNVWLYDLESTGTYLNGERVKGKAPLIGRNTIRLGTKEIVVTSEKDNLL